MKNVLKLALAAVVTVAAVSFTACGGGGGNGGSSETTAEVAGDYSIDMSSLGMNLTVYLNLSAYGDFKLSPKLDFETDKGSGVFSKSGDGYIMSYTNLNGEPVTAADNYISQFTVGDGGVLTFTSEYLYYGAVHVSTVSDDDPDILLCAVPVEDNYEEPDEESLFTVGSYKSEVTEGDVNYISFVNFFEDNTYIHFMYADTQDGLKIASETGTYSVINDQLALIADSDKSNRNSCTVVSQTQLTLSVLPYIGAEERSSITFEKVDSEKIAVFEGEVNSLAGEIEIYSDGIYRATVDGFTEEGAISINSEEGLFKQYPDSVTDGTRGLTKIDNLAYGSLSYSETMMILENVKLRTSAAVYTRYAGTFTQFVEE